MSNKRKQHTRVEDYDNPSIELSESIMAQATHNLMVSWNRYITILWTTLAALLISILYQDAQVLFNGTYLNKNSISTVIAILFFFSNVHAWKILASLRRVFKHAKKQRLFQFLLENEAGIFNPFSSKRSGFLVALPFGMIVALGIAVSMSFVLHLDIFEAGHWGAHYLNYPLHRLDQIVNSVIGFSYKIPTGPRVDRNYVAELVSPAVLAVTFLSFLVFLLALVRTMNRILDFGGWAHHKKMGWRFLRSIALTTMVGLSGIVLFLSEEDRHNELKKTSLAPTAVAPASQ